MNKIRNKYKSIFRFIVIGGLTTLIDFIIYWFISKCLNVTISKVISMLLASIFSFYFNKVWTFSNADSKKIKYLWKYYVTFSLNVLINTTVNTTVFYHTGEKVIAFVIATGVATTFNYLMQKLWVFKTNT